MSKAVSINHYKKRAKRNRRRRRILLLFFLTLVLAGFALFSPYFNIQSITCTGNAAVDANEIIAASAVGIGNNIYRTSLGSAAQHIKKIPYIHDVKVRRKFPNAIEFNVTESVIAAYIDNNGSYIYIDEFGKVLEVNQQIPAIRVPRIENAQITSQNPGENFSSEDPGKFEFIVATIQEIVHNSIEGVTYISIPDCENLSFSINDMLEVKIGNMENLEYKIKFLALESYNQLGPNAKGTLDVSNGKRGVYKETK